MRKKFLVFGKPSFSAAEIKEVVDTIKSGWWGTGQKAEKFENDFKKYLEVKHALALNSATAGLHLALKVLNIGPGDEVITTPLTFCSTVNVIIHCGAKPVFADVDLQSWNINPAEIEKKITNKTKAVLPVHLHGRPCQIDEILKIAKRHNLKIIEDAAHAAEALYHGKHIGMFADITVFSFYATKNIATGEGGMAVTNNAKLADLMRIYSLHGLSRDAYKRYSEKTFRSYECLVPGFKYNMPDIQASLGIQQLKKVEKNAKLRKIVWNFYLDKLSKINELILPAPEEPNTRHARHLFAVLIKPEYFKIKRDEIINNLIKQNIGAGVHFNPVHLQKYYRETFGFQKGDFPNAEFVGERTISLPISPAMTKQDAADVVSTVKSVVKKFRK